MGWEKLKGGYSNSWERHHSQILILEAERYNFIKYFDNGEILEFIKGEETIKFK